MADRYWVGGNGTWDASTTTNWSATSGGAAGASAPTTADNAIFNGSSGTGTVTISSGATCLNLDASAVTANTKFNGQAVLAAQGNVTFAAAATYITAGVSINFTGAVATPTLNCASTNFLSAINNLKTSGTLSIATSACVCNTFGQNVATATTTLSTNLTCVNFYLGQGTFNVNASTLTVSSYMNDYGNTVSEPRTLVLTTGTINFGTNITTTNLDVITWDLGLYGGLTFTRGTGSVVVGSTTPQATSAYFYTANATYYDLLFQGTQTLVEGNITCTGSGGTGLRITSPAGINHEFVLASTSTNSVTAGTFSIVGNSTNNRAYVVSDTLGSPVSINVTGTSTRTLTNVDLQDVAFTFGSSLTGTSIGDCGGNSGVTVTTPLTSYAKTAAPSNYSDAIWFSATNGGGSAQRAPLPQDNVIFDSNTGSSVITVNGKTLGKNITTTGYTGSFAYSVSNPSNTVVSMYGSYTGTGSLLDSIFALRIAGRANVSIPAASPSGYLVIDAFGFTATMSGAINNSSLIIYAHGGTFDTAGYSITASTISLDDTTLSNLTSLIGVRTSTSKAANFNASIVNLTVVSSTVAFSIPYTTATLNAGTSTINLVPSGVQTLLQFFAANNTFYNLTLTPNSSLVSFQLTGLTPTFSSINCVTDYQLYFLFGGTTLTCGSLILRGKKGAGITVAYGRTPLVTFTLAIGSNVTTTYTAFRGVTKSGASTLVAKNVANLGGNTGITFTSQTKTLAFTTGASSFVVPTDYGGSNMFFAVGAGGGAGKGGPNGSGTGGGGSGAMGITSNLPMSKGQTVYYSIGSAGSGATSSGFPGVAGGQTWANINSNSVPAVSGIGAIANGGSGSISGGAGGSGGAGNITVNTINYSGATGGFGSTQGQGGGGAATVGFNYFTSRAGASGGNVAGGGGGGGAGIAAVGGAPVTGASGRGGTGGTGVGAGGTGGAKGTTTSTAGGVGGAGAGGGGSGSVSSNGATAAIGGAGGVGNEITYTTLNGVVSTGTIGPGGAGGGGGGSESSAQTTVTGGAGGAGSYGAGGGGSGRGSTINGNGGNGGGGLLIFVYDIAVGGNFGGVIG
jgi:hypothetical protein